MDCNAFSSDCYIAVCCWQVRCSEATLELQDHVDGLASLHIVRLDCVLVGERTSRVNETNHGHIDTLTLLQSLLDRQNRVRGLEVERLLDSSKGLKHEATISATGSE